jgi:hypothetical protein
VGQEEAALYPAMVWILVEVGVMESIPLAQAQIWMIFGWSVTMNKYQYSLGKYIFSVRYGTA